MTKITYRGQKQRKVRDVAYWIRKLGGVPEKDRRKIAEELTGQRPATPPPTGPWGRSRPR